MGMDRMKMIVESSKFLYFFIVEDSHWGCDKGVVKIGNIARTNLSLSNWLTFDCLREWTKARQALR